MKDKFIIILVEGEWYQDKPHGVCWFSYSDENDTNFSVINGIGTFTNGVLHGGPLLLRLDNGYLIVYSYVKNGKVYGIAKSY